MKAIGFKEHLPIESEKSLVDINKEIPVAKGHDLLVKVNAVSVNPVDVSVRRNGRGQLKYPKIIGWDAVGTVLQIGNQVTNFKTGDRVWYAGSFIRPGSDEEFQLVDERIVGNAPVNLSDEQAAAIPLVGLTAYESLFEQLPIDVKVDSHNKVILIINGAGGVASIAVQLAHLAGLKIIATASRPESIKWAKRNGADYIVNHRQDLVKQVRALGFKYVDYILNLQNLDAHWDEIAQLIKPEGFVAATTENHHLIDLQKLTKKKATFAWEWMYTKSYYHTSDMISQSHILNRLAKLYDDKKLKLIDTKHYSPINAKNLRKAHADVETGHMTGKVTLSGW
ncbi:zinc-binding alcohol dehydrogenase family protein [Lactobacillus acetotolerans]|uniref:zinc-binding alcohol dehydrogenase family protein n=2 Tax=Lactobacillus acetotolerans TaxID=1600 RepID=UPI00241CA77D|nr:zinc-binding alcohol dehydrogenase family protein [Lactobacillus acetotolerans]